jgi:hypothetical protein
MQAVRNRDMVCPVIAVGALGNGSFKLCTMRASTPLDSTVRELNDNKSIKFRFE